MSVNVLPSALIVTGVVSLKVRLLRVMFAPSTTLLCWGAVVEKTTLAPEPGTRPAAA